MLHNYKYSTISEQRELRYRFTPVIGAVKKSYASNETEMYVRALTGSLIIIHIILMKQKNILGELFNWGGVRNMRSTKKMIILIFLETL